MKSKTVVILAVAIIVLNGCSLFQKKSNSVSASSSRSNDKGEGPPTSVVLTSEIDTVELASDVSGIRTSIDPNSISRGTTVNLTESVGLATNSNATGQQTNVASVQIDQAKLETNKNLHAEPPSGAETESSGKFAAKESRLGQKQKKDELYKVKSGDTLMKISFEKYGNIYRWKEIYFKNKDKIRNYNKLTTGTVLLIEGVEYVVLVREGKPYLIRRSDTLAKISKKIYGTTAGWKSLWKNNPELIRDPNRIYAGFTLYYLESSQGPLPKTNLQLGTTATGKDSQRLPAQDPSLKK